MKRIVAGVAALVWLAAEAMPSGAEIAKAKGIIDDLMAADMADARAGKKTHEEVGDAAMALAGEAEKPAEKYLLLTGAFDEYMKDDKFDDANAAIAALREALPDWSQSDELNLLDKALRSAGYGKGGPVRARYEALKERQQYGAKLKKAQAAAKKSPQNRKLQFQVGAYEAALGNWPAAVEAFAKGSNEAIRKAAELEKALENGGEKQLWKVADAWWEAGDVKPPFLAEAISAHAAALYGKALKDDKFTGLKRVAAERRVEEWRARGGAERESGKPDGASDQVGVAKTTGVMIVGGQVKEKDGILSGFAKGSYAKLKLPFEPGKEKFEVVVEFTTGKEIGSECILSTAGSAKSGLTPFFIVNGALCGFVSSDGSTWDVALRASTGMAMKPKTTYRVKCEWDGNAYAWSQWMAGSWRTAKTIKSSRPVFGGLDFALGSNRGMREQFTGTIDLNKSYITIGGKLWWEGARGAYRTKNK